MPIRFRCVRCHQMLGIASRKAGAEIDCPKCGYSQTVPSEEAAAAALAMDQGSRTPSVVAAASELVVYDDEPAAIEMPRPRRKVDEQAPPPAADTSGAEAAQETVAEASPPGEPASPTAPSSPTAMTTTPEPETAPLQGEPVPRGMILFPRHVFYVQGVLFLVLGVITFAAGYFMGRGDASLKLQIEQEEASKERVLVEGTLSYRPGPNQVKPDERGVCIILPVDKFPEKPLIADGIRPSDTNPLKSHPSLRMIRELGGVYARADEQGSFDALVPDKGDYWVLIISGHSARDKNDEIDEPDLEELGHYFGQPELLIGRYKYRFKQETINSGFNPIELDFDLDGES